MAKKYDWAAIKAEYVEAPTEAARPTLEELAKKYGCPPDYMRYKAAKDRWTEEAHIFLTKIALGRTRNLEAPDGKINHLAAEQAKFDADCLKLGRAALGIIANELVSIKGEPDHRRLASVVRSLEIVQRVGRSALGEDEVMVNKLLAKGYAVYDPSLAEDPPEDGGDTGTATIPGT